MKHASLKLVPVRCQCGSRLYSRSKVVLKSGSIIYTGSIEMSFNLMNPKSKGRKKYYFVVTAHLAFTKKNKAQLKLRPTTAVYGSAFFIKIKLQFRLCTED